MTLTVLQVYYFIIALNSQLLFIYFFIFTVKFTSSLCLCETTCSLMKVHLPAPVVWWKCRWFPVMQSLTRRRCLCTPGGLCLDSQSCDTSFLFKRKRKLEPAGALKPRGITFGLSLVCQFKLWVSPPYCGKSAESKRARLRGGTRKEK